MAAKVYQVIQGEFGFHTVIANIWLLYSVRNCMKFIYAGQLFAETFIYNTAFLEHSVKHEFTLPMTVGYSSHTACFTWHILLHRWFNTLSIVPLFVGLLFIILLCFVLLYAAVVAMCTILYFILAIVCSAQWTSLELPFPRWPMFSSARIQ